MTGFRKAFARLLRRWANRIDPPKRALIIKPSPNSATTLSSMTLEWR